jgi:hypothetical protein
MKAKLCSFGLSRTSWSLRQCLREYLRHDGEWLVGNSAFARLTTTRFRAHNAELNLVTN